MQDLSRLRCSRCKLKKSISEFHRDRKRKYGRQSFCKSCFQAWQREWRKSPKGKASVSRVARKQNYGLSDADYQAMKTAQQGVCAICEKPPTDLQPLSVDHDHENGKLRGLLCNRCNRGLGFLKDDVSLLKRAIVYLKLHSSSSPSL